MLPCSAAFLPSSQHYCGLLELLPQRGIPPHPTTEGSVQFTTNLAAGMAAEVISDHDFATVPATMRANGPIDSKFRSPVTMSYISRRQFGSGMLALAGCSTLPPGLADHSHSSMQETLCNRLIGKPRVYCLAWIDPTIQEQNGQEHNVSRFPIAFVTQDIRPLYRRWKDDIRTLNPDIVYLAYHVVIEETTVPGPGHAHMQTLKNAWVTWPGGYQPKVTIHRAKQRRIWDPRAHGWKERFLESCALLLDSYPYDGLFLDQCTIFSKAAPSPSAWSEMKAALQETLTEARQLFPNALLIGNSKYKWAGLNGELNENRPRDYEKELQSFAGHASPEMAFCVVYDDPISPSQSTINAFAVASAHDAWFCVTPNAQVVRWSPIYDQARDWICE